MRFLRANYWRNAQQRLTSSGMEAPDLTVAQTATLLGVSERTVTSWIDSGRLRAYRLGPRLIRIQRDALDALRGDAREVRAVTTQPRKRGPRL